MSPKKQVHGNQRPPGPEISIVIISKDRHTELLGTVTAIRHQLEVRHPGIDAEIVVVEEADEPNPIPGIRYRHLPRRDLGFGFARNHGVRAARGEIIVFADDDITPSEKWLEYLLTPFEDPAVVSVGGGVIPAPDGLGPVGSALGLLGFPAGGPLRIPRAWEAPQAAQALSTTNCAFRRSAFERIGGFDSTFVYGGEDSDFFFRLAQHGKLVYYGRAFVYHRQREDLGRVFRWGVRRGMAYFCLDCARRGPVFSLLGPLRRSILPKIILALILATWVGARFGPFLGIGVALFLSGIWAFVAVAKITLHLSTLRQVHTAELLAAFPRIVAPRAVAWLPLVKLLVDLGESWGRWAMARQYIHLRFRQPPSIYKVDPAQFANSADLSEEAVRRLVVKSRKNHARITTVSELADRLQNAPHTLFFQPLTAIMVHAPGAELRNRLRSLLIDDIPLGLALPLPPLPASENPPPADQSPTSPEAAAIPAFPEELRQLEYEGAEIAALLPNDAFTHAEKAADIFARFRSALGHPPRGAALSGTSAPDPIREAAKSAEIGWLLTARPGGVQYDTSPFDLPSVPFTPNTGREPPGMTPPPSPLPN